MSPLTLESSASAPAASLQRVLVGGLFYECAVTSRQVAGQDTDSQCCHKKIKNKKNYVLATPLFNSEKTKRIHPKEIIKYIRCFP